MGIIRYAFPIAFVMTLFAGGANAKRPQVLPEQMLVNLFALTEASAALQICADSASFDKLTKAEKVLAERLQDGIETLVRQIGRKYDDDLFGFFVETRNSAAARPDKIEEMRTRYDYCENGFLERMKAYVYASRQKLDYFLSLQPDAR